MRLVCPNCAAQYEIEDGVIPPSGRDVQCSSCNETWFQARAKSEPKTSRPRRSARPKPPLPEPETEAGTGAEDDAPEAAAAAGGAAAVSAAVSAEASAADGADAAGPAGEWVRPPSGMGPVLDDYEPEDETDQQRRMLDDSVLNILREEADREARARKAEAAALETQPDLGLSGDAGAASVTAADTPAEPAAPGVVGEAVAKGRSRAAARRKPGGDKVGAATASVVSVGAEETGAAEGAAKGAFGSSVAGDGSGETGAPTASRRAMLPDIEQINATLHATSDHDDQAEMAAYAEMMARRRTGFRLGFLSVMTLTAVGLGVYSAAPGIARVVPTAVPALAVYVARMDEGRVWLDGHVQTVTAWMQDRAEN